MITEQYKELIRRCEQCGTCTASCPTKEVSDFNIRKLVRHLQLEIHENEDFLCCYPWLCTLCFRCKELCTEGLEIPKLVWALRELALNKKVAPKKVDELLETIKSDNSSYVLRDKSKTSRIKPPLKVSENADTLYWMGCTPSIRAPNIVSATANVLYQLGHEFKVLEKEPCCGEPLICLGLFDEAKEIAKKVVKKIKDANVKQMVVSCSGCHNAFTKLYPEVLGVELKDIEILHTSLYFQKNLNDLKLENLITVTYHDPCTLGRHAGVYEEPRKVLESIDGLKLVEMERNRQFASCCGGGGGLPSLEPEMSLKIAEEKLIKEILPLGVEALVTSCPMCYLNFKFTATKKKIPLRIYDLSEIVSMNFKK